MVWFHTLLDPLGIFVPNPSLKAARSNSRTDLVLGGKNKAINHELVDGYSFPAVGKIWTKVCWWYFLITPSPWGGGAGWRHFGYHGGTLDGIIWENGGTLGMGGPLIINHPIEIFWLISDVWRQLLKADWVASWLHQLHHIRSACFLSRLTGPFWELYPYTWL